MTTAKFERDGDTCRITIEGHAGFSDTGSDIVCASCSMLVCTLLQCLGELAADGGIYEMTQIPSGGHVRIEYKPMRWAREKARTIEDVIASGFALLEDKYPDHVRLTVRGRNK